MLLRTFWLGLVSIQVLAHAGYQNFSATLNDGRRITKVRIECQKGILHSVNFLDDGYRDIVSGPIEPVACPQTNHPNCRLVAGFGHKLEVIFGAIYSGKACEQSTVRSIHDLKQLKTIPTEWLGEFDATAHDPITEESQKVRISLKYETLSDGSKYYIFRAPNISGAKTVGTRLAQGPLVGKYFATGPKTPGVHNFEISGLGTPMHIYLRMEPYSSSTTFWYSDLKAVEQEHSGASIPASWLGEYEVEMRTPNVPNSQRVKVSLRLEQNEQGKDVYIFRAPNLSAKGQVGTQLREVSTGTYEGMGPKQFYKFEVLGQGEGPLLIRSYLSATALASYSILKRLGD